MKCFHSLLTLASMLALATPAWSGDAKLSARRIQAAPQAQTQARTQAEKASPKPEEASAEQTSADITKPSRALLTDRTLQVVELQRPDLWVEAIPPAGDRSARFFIHNTGKSNSGGFRVSFLCSYIPYSNGLADPGLRQGCQIPPITVSPGVPAGAVDSRQIPAELLPQGPVLVSLSVTVDSQGQVQEINESNNSDSTSWH